MHKRVVFLLLTLICLVISFTYRNRSYFTSPPVSDTFDEFASAWLGLSLVRGGIPTSWSFLPIYRSGIPKGAKLELVNTNLVVDGVVPNLKNYSTFPKPISLTREISLEGYKSHFDIVSPDLEYPPLGGLLVSLPYYFSSVKNFSDVKLVVLRKPFVILGTLSTLLVVWLAYLWYGKWVSIASGFIYATVPTVVFGSRLALPENILTTAFLLELIFLEYYRSSKKTKYIIFALILSFLAPLIKPFGMAASLIGVGYFVLINKNYRYVSYFVLSGLISILAYFGYGIFYDKNTFFAALSFQTSRFFAGPIVFMLKILVPRVTRIFLDGWIFFGWISVFILAFMRRNKDHDGILIASFSYIVGLVLFGGEDFGWYRLPLYPFLLIAAGYIFVELVKKPNFFGGFIFATTAIVTGLQLGLGVNNWSNNLIYFRIFILVVVGVLGLSYFIKRKNVEVFQSVFLVSLFLLSLFLNTRIINNARDVWETMGETSSLIINRK